ncbi:MAG: hypothetical protein ACO1SX_03005, partial [Actinomycetota bacterium]
MTFRTTTLLKLRSRWPALALVGALTTGSGIAAVRLRAAVEEQLPGFLRQRLAAALNREVELGAIHVSALGIHVEDLRVLRLPTEREDPLVAKSTRVGVDWWRLLSERKLRVTGAEVADAKIRLTDNGTRGAGQPWTTQVLALSNTGLEKVSLRNASVQMLPTTGSDGWSTEAASGQLVLGSRQFHFQAKAKQFTSPEVTLTRLSLSGDGNAEGIKLDQGAGVYQGAQIGAKGTLKAAGNEALMTVTVQRMPLGRLATRMGIPAEWAMQGSVSGKVTVDARDNSLRSIQGVVDVTRGSLTRDGGKLPWRSAHAELDWTPENARLTNVRVQGDGVALTSSASVTLAPGKAFTAGRFRAGGEITAANSAAVAQV